MEKILSLVLPRVTLPTLKKVALVSKTCYNLAINQLYIRTKIFPRLTRKYIKPAQKICLINRTTKEVVRLQRRRVPVVLMALLTPHRDVATREYCSRWQIGDKFSVCSKYRPELDTYNAILYL